MKAPNDGRSVSSILVADDSIVTRKLTAALLRNEGYLVSCVSDGRQAFEWGLRSLRPEAGKAKSVMT